MRRTIINYSLLSAFCVGLSALASPEEDSKALAKITKLEAQAHEAQQQGHNDPQLLSGLAHAYYKGKQFKKGNETYNQILSLYQHDRSANAASILQNTLLVWGIDEDLYARNVSEGDLARLKVLAVLDQFPADSPARLEGHRIMIRTYRMHHQEKEADGQIQQLAKLMGTTDMNVLLPPPHCPACGRG